MIRQLWWALAFVVCLGCSGGDGGDGSSASADASISPGDGGNCVPETNSELCQQAGFTCGQANRVDRCGMTRELSCGSCNGGSCVGNRCESNALCEGACEAQEYTACTCDPSDPCGWQNDGICDSQCSENFPNHFEDPQDCQTISSNLGTSCTSNDDCVDQLTCAGGSCVCCNDPEEIDAQWECHATTVPSIAGNVCGVSRAASVAGKYGQAALPHVGVGCYSGSPSNYWCPEELQCVSRVEADEFRCGCCAEVQGHFMCSYDVSFARTFCLGIDQSCADGSCLPCIGPACEPECPTTKNGVCDEPEGTNTCPNGSDFTDCKP